jgi:hypothetical protein
MKCLKSNYKLFLILIISLIFLKSHAQEHGGCATPEFNEEEEYKSGCDHTSDTWINKYRTPGHWIPDENTPIKTIMVNWIVCRDDNGQNGWQDVPEFHESVSSLFDKVNLEYSTSLPKGYSLTCEPEYTHVEDTRIRFELNEVIFIDKTEFNLGCSATDILDYVFAQYPDARNFLNHIFTQGDAPCIPGAWGRYNIYWAEDVSYVHTWGSMWHDWYADFFDHSYHVIHEYAHAVGLHHVYNTEYTCTSHYDFLDDVFGLCAEAGCNSCGSGNCDGNQVCYLRYDCFWQYNTVNTPIMSAAYDIRYISPKSSGRMHRALSLYDRTFKVNNKPMHKYVKEDHSYEIPLTITENETWDFAIKMYQDIVVEQGATLTISCDVKMPIDGKIIVKPGGKLIIDGGYVTSAHNKLWQGIEVWGNPNASQEEDESGNYQQGYLELMNGATIENAQTAVALRKEGTWASHGGGIVKAYDANFINNAKSVWFSPYKNMFFRTVGGDTLEFEMLNESRFELCNFEVNENYFDDSEFFKHADIVQVHRIPFIGCNFSVSGTESASTYNSAIAAYSAGVNVDQYDSETPSTFTGFYCGIVSTHDASTNVYYSMVQNSNFINNSVGIRNTGTNNFKIIDNHFEIGENNGGKGACGWAPGYGVDLRAATGFVIENNSFEPVQGNTGDTYGVRIFETHTAGDDVYKNIYNGLTVANLSDGINAWNSEDLAGLSYLCNSNNNNVKDFLIDGVDPEIFINQGSASMGAGNTFSSTATMHLENTGTEGFNYHYFGSGPDPTKCTPSPLVNLYAVNSANSCPDHYGGPGGGVGLNETERAAKETEFETAKENFNAVESLYNSLTDGGNSEGTELTIASAQPGDTWVLRANLLGMSPYLSKEVLIEASDRTDVLPESVLFEILSANPDELKKGELISYLENKEQPLPEYMIEILKQMAGGATAKTALLSQMGEYKSLEISTAKEIIHSILFEEELDHENLRTWLANLESYNADRQIISSFISQGDISSAQDLMDLLPELYELNGDALSEHNEWADLMNMQLNWQAEGRNPTNLTEAELATLYNLADNGGTKAKYQARGILEHFYGENYIDCCTPPDGNKSTVADFNKNDLAKAMGLYLEAMPNPAKHYTEISYTLPFDVENAILNVYDASGRLIEQKQLNSAINKVAYNTSELVSGSYAIEIKTNEYSYSIKLIVQ